MHLIIVVALYISLFILSVILLWPIVILKLSRKGRMACKFNGAAVRPIFGNAGIFIGDEKDIPKKLSKYISKYGRCCVFWKLHDPWILVADHRVAEEILGCPRLVEKGKEYDPIRDYMGLGLLMSYKKEWKRDRRIIHQGFKLSMFPGFLEAFNKQSKILCEILQTDYTSEWKQLNKAMLKCTLNIALKTTLGAEMDLQTEADPNANYTFWMEELSYALILRISKPWLYLPGLWRMFGVPNDKKYVSLLQNATLREIEKRKQQLLENPEALTFVDIILQSGGACSTGQCLTDHVTNLLAAASDTTAKGLVMTLFLLAKNPVVQTRVCEEIDSIFMDDLDRDVSMDDLVQMKYLEMCIKEALRIYPPAPVITRTMDEDVPLENHPTIPQGADAVFMIYDIHRDPEVYPNPEVYDPDRFLPETCSKRSPFSYLPFSAGVRNCVGHRYAIMEMKVILATIFRKLTVQAKEERNDVHILYGMALEFTPIHFKFFSRNSN